MTSIGKVRSPEFPPESTWLNVERPLSLAEDLRGQVVVLDFWTYCCINCLHVLPVLSRVEQRFALRPVTVVGVHSAKFLSERDPENIRRAVQRYHVQHPVVVDSQHDIWQAFTVKAWPTLVLVDAEGYVREHLQGEIEEEDLARRIDELLEEGREKGVLAAGPLDLHPDPSADHSLLYFPGKVEADDRHVYVSDSGHHRVLIADHQGKVLRRIGGQGVGSADGRYDTASFWDPQGLSVLDHTLYVADRANHLLRAIDLDLYWVKTLAGTGAKGTTRGAVDPSRPREIGLRSPWDVQAVGQHLVIAMAGSHQLWLYDVEKGEIGAWAGSGVEDHIDGALHEAAFAQPSGLCLAGHWLMVADSEVSSVRAVDLSEGQVQTVVGAGLFDFGDVDGEGEQVMLQHCMDVALLEETLYVADTYNGKIKAIDLRTRRATTVFGNGDPSVLHEPAGICAFGDSLLVADTNNHRLLIADPASGSLQPFELHED